MKKISIGIVLTATLLFLPIAAAAFTPKGMIETDENLQQQINYLTNENGQLKIEMANLRIEIDGIKNEVRETKSLIDILLGLLKQLQILISQLITKLVR